MSNDADSTASSHTGQHASESYDVAVIGLGPGGEHVAGSLAQKGFSVLAIEKRLVGGECPYYGCIPSKMMIRAANTLAEARRVPELAGTIGDLSPDFGIVARRIRDEATTDWDDTIAVDRLTDQGARVVKGTGRIADTHTVEVDGTSYRIDRAIVVNTGTDPVVPPIPGLAEAEPWTNRDLVAVTELPRSLAVLGGGPIGCEFGQALARFGVQVSIIEGAERLLGHDEPEASEKLTEVLRGEGIEVHLGVRAERVDRADGRLTIGLSDGGTVTADKILVATGRSASPSAVGLDTVGVPTDARTVEVDARCRVTDGVWAIGDITGVGAFTHLSMYQADLVIADVAADGSTATRTADYRALPRVTFTDPEVAATGLTEEQARDEHRQGRLGRVSVASTPMEGSTRGFIHGAGAEGVIKLVADAEAGVLVGATAMGPSAGEMIAALQVAIAGRVPVSTLADQIWAYPTFARGIGSALPEVDR